MSVRLTGSTVTARVRPSTAARVPQRTALIVRATKDDKENPYHDRKKDREIKTGGATKDAGAMKQDADDQYAYQQERLEWRRKNQTGGDVGDADREDKPHVNIPFLHGDDASGEFRARGPNRADDPPPSTSLGASDNPLGNLIRKITGKEEPEEE
ncbi:MAG: hypothetical protein WDW36_006954 [Sanguina aurantia]